MSGSKNPKRIRAFELRRKGKSYNEIIAELGVSKGTVSYWFKDIDWSKDVREQLELRAKEIATVRLIRLNEGKRKRREQIYAVARKESYEEFSHLRTDPLFVAGIFAYWGEGDKKNKNTLKFCNTDPGIVKIYMDFLRKSCSVPRDRINVWLLLYPDLDENICKKFWEDVIGRKNFSFKKTIVIEGRHKTKRIAYGVCNVVVHSSCLKLKMLEWIRLFSEDNLFSKYSIKYPAAMV